MQILPGSQAVSHFRLDKLLAQLQAMNPAIRALQAQYIHLIQTETALDETQKLILQRLLDYGDPVSENNLADHCLYVTPRVGTQSPWSSKALDIAHNCGLLELQHLERGVAWNIHCQQSLSDHDLTTLASSLHDRMTEEVFLSTEPLANFFSSKSANTYSEITAISDGKQALEQANQELGLALSDFEISYLMQHYEQLGRNPSDVELMMFAQANSEHCRHKIFNASWIIDQQAKQKTLFGMIRDTHQRHPGRVLSAYHDNAAVTKGYLSKRFYPDPEQLYQYTEETINILMKVETHNHPTAISPLPGAATGSGGEIRDEAATGRGAKPKAGLCGFSVSNLMIPEHCQPWEQAYGKPDHMVSALDIMLEGPIGAAAYNNEFGRPGLCGYFRSYEQYDAVTERQRGYHKPIMIAGGYGMVRDDHIDKHTMPAGSLLVVLGGPAMLIGLGGGAASSVASGSSQQELDFASVQRHNPEIQRRCQEVVDRCWALGKDNPIVSIHDVGAGGLSNALPELVSDSERGAIFDLRAIPNSEPGLSPMEIWCNEAQERYVLAIEEKDLPRFEMLCQRERAPFAVIGRATSETELVLDDKKFSNTPINIPMEILLGKLPQMQRTATTNTPSRPAFETADIEAEDAVYRLLNLPAIADKRFLIHIADRSVGGLVHRDQMVGPWQMPVADCAVTMSAYGALTGEAMAMGERPSLALIDAPASGRMAIAEAITNIAAARIKQLGDISLSANWMAACGQLDEDSKLYSTVEAVSQICQQLGICIPVGKDSLSMHTHWQQNQSTKHVTSPVSLVVTAFAPVIDIEQSLTPLLDTAREDSILVLIDLGRGLNRLGGSCLAQVYQQIGNQTPDLEHATDLASFFRAIQIMNDSGHLLAYHDRSDGGVLISLIEMALTSRCGLSIDISKLGPDPLSSLFAEEAGAVVQIPEKSLEYLRQQICNDTQLEDHIHVLGRIQHNKEISIDHNGQSLLRLPLTRLQQQWSNTSYQLQRLRDNPNCAEEEYSTVTDLEQPGLFLNTNFKLQAPAIHTQRPKIAILREQGVNGQLEMAAAFHQAGFDTFDIHMSDILGGQQNLENMQGLAVCGGFSYGDVLGAGGGWAKSILMVDRARDCFQTFFQRPDTFALGVCNGCQMLSQLRELIPGTRHWPDFHQNTSEQFEARLVMVEILDSPSILLQGMAGSQIPIVISHGEGRAVFKPQQQIQRSTHCMQYIDHLGRATEHYPANPNGSPDGVTGICSEDGRFTILMPHPERVFLRDQFSWIDPDWRTSMSPWMQMFYNAREWLD